MTARKTLVKLGTAAGAGAAALAILAGPQALASTGGTVQGYNSSFGMDFGGVTHEQYATECSNTFSGPVTSDDGNGNIVASIDNFSITNCDQGVSITANALPWTFKGANINNGGSFTIEGVDVNITTAQGTCRYTGTMEAGPEFPPNVYDITGTLSRQSAGCGGDEQVQVSAPVEVVGQSG